MIEIENVEVMGWEAAIRGMRNPMNSWEKSDSIAPLKCDDCNVRQSETMPTETKDATCRHCCARAGLIGLNDSILMMKLRNAGTDHRKFM